MPCKELTDHSPRLQCSGVASWPRKEPRVLAAKVTRMRKRLIAVGALAAAVLASTALASAVAAELPPPPLANIVTCSGVGLISQTVQAVECNTDATTGTADWSPDLLGAKLQAKAKPDSPPAAAVAGWSANAPLAVSGNQFCVTVKASPHGGPSTYAVLELVLSWDGVQQPTLAFPVSHETVSYCAGDIPPAAENFFWEVLAVTGASHGDAKVKVQFGGVSFAAVP